MAELPVEAKIALPVVLVRDDEWVARERGRGGRYRKRFAAQFKLPFLERRTRRGFFSEYVAHGSTHAAAKAALTETITRVLTEFDDPEFLQLGDHCAVVFCGPISLGDGIQWGYRIFTPAGLRTSCIWEREREQARGSAVRMLAQDYACFDIYDADRIEKAAEFADTFGQNGNDTRRYAAWQRGYAYAESIGERDPHSWMQYRVDEFLTNFDRPGSSEDADDDFIIIAGVPISVSEHNERMEDDPAYRDMVHHERN